MRFAAAGTAVVVALLFCAPVHVSAAAVALACADYAATTTPVSVNFTQSGVLKPSTVVVDTGQWVFFADDTVSKIVRYTGDSTKPTFEQIAASTMFGSISGLCLNPKDQSLYVTDALNNSLFVIPCVAVGEPANPKSGPFCSKYADYSGVYNVPLSQPSACAVDKAGNIFVTQKSPDLIIINSTAFSYSTVTIAGAVALSPVAVDLQDYDVYLGDATQSKLFRLPCNEVDAAGEQCMSLSSTPTNPNPSPIVTKSTSGIALNRGDGTGDFDLIISDSSTSKIVSISHPKSSSASAGTLLLQLGAEDAPEDIALDPIRFDLIVAEPQYALPSTGSLVRLPCNSEVFAPSPAVGPQPQPTTTSTTAAPDTTGMSPGSVFLLLLFLVALVYFGGGAVFLKVTQQRWGVPNEQMWRNFAGLVRDGFYFAFCCGRRPAAPVPYDGGKFKASTDGTDNDAGPRYENYDAHDDL